MYLRGTIVAAVTVLVLGTTTDFAVSGAKPKFSKGKIVERRNVTQPVPAQSANGNGIF
jgi:hypothetical protein